MKILNGSLKTFILISVCCSASHGDEGIKASHIDKLTESVKGAKTKTEAQKRLCKKANLFSRTISLRSLDGNLCVGPLGAFALLTCKGYSDNDGPFTDSACYKKAVASVGKGDPEASATTLLVNSLKSTASTTFKIVKPLVCTVGPLVLDITGAGAPLGVALGTGCGALNTIEQNR